MKSIKNYLAIGVFMLTFSSCAAPPRPPKPPTPPKRPGHAQIKPMPPGQAKKVFAMRSAKSFVPGQNK